MAPVMDSKQLTLVYNRSWLSLGYSSHFHLGIQKMLERVGKLGNGGIE
jgi:hypothetical protein